MTLRVKDRYFIVSSVEARHKKYSFHGLNKMPTNDVVEFNDILRRAQTEHNLRMKGVIK